MPENLELLEPGGLYEDPSTEVARQGKIPPQSSIGLNLCLGSSVGNHQSIDHCISVS